MAGAAVFLHGLGDHGGRHLRQLEVFASRGIAVLAVDLPGHGRSAGRRGYLGRGFQIVYQIVDEAFDHLRESGYLPAGAPVGLCGHSMGGFLALNYLADRRPALDFVWLSSALCDARPKVPAVLRPALRLAAFVAPGFTTETKIRSELCKRDPERISEAKGDPLVHRSLSLRLASDLLVASASLSGRLAAGRPVADVLFTHGGADAICPPEIARRVSEAMPAGRKHFAEFPELLHEPFNDLGRASFFQTLEDWVSSSALASRRRLAA